LSTLVSISATPQAASLKAEAAQYVRQAQSIVNGSPASFLAAISLYDEALARDPDSVAALSGRATNRAALVWTGSPLAHGLDLAQQDAERALVLEPDNSDALSVLASINSMRGEWIAAETHFQAAMTAHPGDAGIRARYALSLLLPTGQLRKAVTEAKRAQSQASDNGGFTAAMLAFASGAQGADDEAVHFADLMVARGGDARQVAHIYIAAAARRGAYGDAADRAIATLPLDVRDAGGDSAFRHGFAALGQPLQQRSAVTELRRLTADPVWDHTDTWGRWPVLFLLASMGAVDDLYDEMGRMLRKEGDQFPQIIAIGSLWSSDMQVLREDRRFAALVDRLGLIGYWRKVGPPDGCRLVHAGIDCASR
jgi:tetratricopeptide (TPR) repeat protein